MLRTQSTEIPLLAAGIGNRFSGGHGGTVCPKP